MLTKKLFTVCCAALMAAAGAGVASAAPVELDELLVGVQSQTARDYIIDHWREGWYDGRHWWVNGNRYTPSRYRDLLINRSVGVLPPPGLELAQDTLPEALPEVVPPTASRPAATASAPAPVYVPVPVQTPAPSYRYSDDLPVFLGLAAAGLITYDAYRHHHSHRSSHRPPPPPPPPPRHHGGHR